MVGTKKQLQLRCNYPNPHSCFRNGVSAVDLGDCAWSDFVIADLAGSATFSALWF